MDRDTAVKQAISQIEKQLRNPPYAFTLDDIYSFSDKSGISFAPKYSKRFIHDFLQEQTHDKGDKHIPVIVRFISSDKKGYFIAREKIVPLFLKELSTASVKLRSRYVEDWLHKIHDGAKDPAMKSIGAFQKELTDHVDSEFPLLAGLFTRGLLFLAKEETQIPASVEADMERCFNKEHDLIPIDELLGLDARTLLKDAKSRLPFWETVPMVRHFTGFFKSLFGGSRKKRAKRKPPPKKTTSFMEVRTAKKSASAAGKPASSGGKSKSSAADARARMKKAVQVLKKEFLDGDKSLNRTLSQLAERWNPLLDPKAKKNLIEDVNALIRDFLRKLKKSFQLNPPDVPRVQTLAEDLSRNKNLKAIKRKDDLVQYIELYIIKCLDGG